MPKSGRPSHHYIGVDNKTLNDALRRLDEVYAQNKALFTRLHNIQVDQTALIASLNRLLSALLETLPSSVTTTEAQAVVRDWLNHIKPKQQ